MTTSTTADPRSYREITDERGRTYRIGESDRSILGHGRALMVYLPWACMMAVSVFEYAYGSAKGTLAQAHGWTETDTSWVLTIWVFFQAGVAAPAGWLREKGILTARRAIWVGSVCSLIGFLSISHFPSVVMAIIGFGVIGGVGTGCVYATCINMVGKWYPDKRGARTGFVNGGFAYGSLPFIVIFNYWFTTSNYRLVLDLVGLFVLVSLGVMGYFFLDPPKNWWPASVDPLKAAAGEETTTTLAKNPPAVRQFTPGEAWRTGQIALMWISLAFISGVSIFGIAFEVPFAKDLGFGPLTTSLSAGILAVVNGVGRAAVGWFSDVVGRRSALIIVLIIEALAQFGTLLAGNTHNELLFLAMAFVSGFGAGAFYPMFAALVPDFFGENHNATNYGMVYSAKLVSGLFGSGLGAVVIVAWGYTGAFTLAGAMGFISAALALTLRQPGRTGAAANAAP